MSTRLYVAVLTTGILAVVLCALAAAAYGALALSLRAQLDESIAAEGTQLSDYFLASADSPFAGNALPVSAAPFEAVAPSGSAFRLVAADGRVLAQSAGSVTAPLGRSAYGAGLTAAAYETVVQAGARYRVYSLPLLLPARAEGVLQIARPLAPVEETLSRLRLVLVAGTGLGLLLAVGIGLLVAHVAAKPLEDVASATARIRAFGADDERLAPPGHLQEPQWLAQSLNQLLDRVALAEEAAGEADSAGDAAQRARQEQRAQVTAYVQQQLGRLLAEQRSLNEFLRTELRPDDARAGAPESQEHGALQGFLRTEPRRWTEAYDDVVAWLEAQSDALERWLERLPLALGAGEESPVGHAAVSLAPLLAQICRSPRANSKEPLEIAYQPEGAPVVRGEPRSLRIALATLVEHARDRTLPGGTVSVHLRCDEHTVTLSVADAGPDIAPDDLPRVFAHAYEAGNSAGDRRLGLPFAHDVIVRHGGAIALESAPGEGATFTVRLPRDGNGGI